ncbi:ATP-dependent DNA ligase [Allonocardiopsis opalescens]|uniref:ATP dependent DNA ligase-like protein n=1 Tax=Allonocardiopsis opalescens TaxID=1144618 RepID=A0A2T0Q7J6_9ACTN|nr:ATP-dependent DNA ligase [Allonocardiopsis opalescens]PRX99788.1 ATP dependent DNA ligase-like protein [Allonocardiopsis opalescens]
MEIRPAELMLARTIDSLPYPESCEGGCRYEPKYDGIRALGTATADGAGLRSGTGRPLSDAFPEIVAALVERLPESTVDGEIVRWSDGRLDHAALRRRYPGTGRTAQAAATAEPCQFAVFDLLELRGASVREQPLSVRRRLLAELLGGEPPESVLTLVPQTRSWETAREWFEALPPRGFEGLVVKEASGRYRPGVHGWWCYRHRATTEAIIGGVTGTLRRPRELILGRYPAGGGELRVVGRTAPLAAAEQQALAALLRAAGPGHPWPAMLPPRANGDLLLRYTKVEPELVAEVSAGGGAHDPWRRPVRYLRVRTDITAAEAPFDGAVQV